MGTLMILAAAFMAPAMRAAVRTDPPEPFYVGDHVRIQIDVAYPARNFAEPDAVVENLQNYKVQWLSDSEGMPTILEIAGWATRQGEIALGAGGYIDRDGNRRDFRSALFRVHALPDSDDPNRTIREIERIERPAVVMETALASHNPIHAGERVVVEWWKVSSPEVSVHMGLAIRLEEHPRSLKVEGARETDLHESRGQRFDTYGGVLLKKERVARYYFLPEKEGSYKIPAVRFEGEYSRLRDEKIYSRWFFRTAPSLAIDVLPRPKGARGPIGTFEMKCSAARGLSRYWPILDVTVSGTGSLTTEESPRITSPLQYAVVSIPNTATIDDETGIVSLRWSLEIHRRMRRMQLPDIVFSYYDVDRGAIADLRCTPPLVSFRKPTEETSATESDASATGATPSSDAPGWLSLVEFALVAILALGFLGIRRAFRP